MVVILNWETAETTLVEVPCPVALIVLMVATHVGRAEPAQVSGQLPVLSGPQYHVPVRMHQAEAQEADRLCFVGLPHHLDEGLKIGDLGEELQSSGTPVEHVVDHPTL